MLTLCRVEGIVCLFACSLSPGTALGPETCRDPSPMGLHALNMSPGVKGQIIVLRSIGGNTTPEMTHLDVYPQALAATGHLGSWWLCPGTGVQNLKWSPAAGRRQGNNLELAE